MSLSLNHNSNPLPVQRVDPFYFVPDEDKPVEQESEKIDRVSSQVGRKALSSIKAENASSPSLSPRSITIPAYFSAAEGELTYEAEVLQAEVDSESECSDIGDNHSDSEEAQSDTEQAVGSKAKEAQSAGQKPKTVIEVELEGLSKAIENLDAHYAKMKREFQELGSVEKNVLEIGEYFSVNKDNIFALLELLSSTSEEAENWLGTLDNIYKGGGHIAPLTNNFFRHRMMRLVQEQLQVHEQHYARLRANMQKKAPYAPQLQEIKKLLDKFEGRLEKDEKELVYREGIQGASLLTKAPTPFVKYFEPTMAESFSKRGKHCLKVIRNGWGLWELQAVRSFQEEWLHRLQPRIRVNIQSDDPTPAQIAQLANQASAQDQLFADVREFMHFLGGCQKIEDVKAKFNKLGISFELPSTIEDFRDQLQHLRFKRHLIQTYFYCVAKHRAIMNENQVLLHLRKKEEEHNRKVTQCIPSIARHIDKCRNMTLDDIKTHFAKLHVHIDDISISNQDNLPCPPQTKAEWEECIVNDEFCRALAGERVKFQEATAQLSLQATRQALLSKHSVEDKFLNFRKVEYWITIASSLAQIYFGNGAKEGVGAALELLVTEISKHGFQSAGVVFLFYPDLNFKLESLVMRLAEHFFAVKYKPNEYSFKGYQISSQIPMINLILMVHRLYFCLKFIVLWLNMRLIENCIMHLEKKAIVEDERYIEMTNQYEQYRLDCQHRIQELTGCLDQLILKDAKLIVSPAARKESSSKRMNPFKDIADALKETDVDYFPPEVKEFFEEHLGFKLENATKDNLQAQFEKVFTASEDKFVEQYRSSRLMYLRA